MLVVRARDVSIRVTLSRQGKISNSDHVNDVLIPSTVVPTWLRFHLQRVNIIGDYFASPICP